MQILQKQLAVAAQIRPLRRIVQAACYIIGYFLVIDALQKFDPLEIIQLADDISIFQQEHIGKIVELDMGLLLIKAVNNKTEICAQSTHHIDAAIPNGASEVNQLNRIKLMLSTAQKNLKKEQNLRS